MKAARIGIIGFGFMGTTHWGVYKGLKNAQVLYEGMKLGAFARNCGVRIYSRDMAVADVLTA